jgi:putative ABC transport system ATP-binding protein
MPEHSLMDRSSPIDELSAPRRDARPLIEARRISKVYTVGEQTVRALDDVSLSIRLGEFVAIMGPSGSGKSTMMNLSGALDVPTSGTMELDGRNIATLDSDALADLRNRTIGFVFQQFNLLARTTALRQVMLPLLYANPRPADAEGMARHRLEQVGLSDRMDHYPSQLSGGQQQRVAIARALAGKPRLLLADEPTGNLDSQMARSVMELLEEINGRGTTILMVTHDPELAARAQRNVHIVDGQVSDLVTGTPVLRAAEKPVVVNA